MNRTKFSHATLLLSLALTISFSVSGQTVSSRPDVCPVPLDIATRPEVDKDLQPGATSITEDSLEAIEGGITRLQGNVEVTRDSQQIKADVVDMDQANSKLDVKGHVNYWDDFIYARGQEARVDLKEKTASLGDAEYRVLTNRGRGKAGELHIIAHKVTEARNVEYSTCDPDGDKTSLATNAWKLSAGEITLNHETGWGIGRNVVLKIKDIPVFYTPYMTFPLNNKRKSGFLTPEFGNSRRNGAELRLPYYWNIAPNMDATITPRIISDSGLMMMGEFRYLTKSSHGSINAEYLPSDSNYNDKDRSYVSLEHKQKLPFNGKLHIVYNNLSDKRYLEDFGPSLDLTSLSAVDRYAELSFAGDNWQAYARVQGFQSVNRASSVVKIPSFDFRDFNYAYPYVQNPYKRLPEIGFNYTSPHQNHAFNFALNSEFVYFERNVTDFSPFQQAAYLGPPPPRLPSTFFDGTIFAGDPLLTVPGAYVYPDPVTHTYKYLTVSTPRSAWYDPYYPASVMAFIPANMAPNNYLANMDGARFDINPSVSYPIRTLSYFIEPKVGMHYTSYHLSGAGPFNDSPDRFLPYASLDAGLFLERHVNLFNENVTQTLEPRLYYLYIPKENQDNIPVFDTGLYDDSFDSLFYENRYSGIDRINDANRVTLAVTSRLLSDSGRELGHLSIGQIYNLHRQEVTLPGQYIPDRNLSPLVFELGTALSDTLSLQAGWQWQPKDNRMQQVDLRLRYRPDSGRVLNVAYRKRRAFAGVIRTDAIDIEQTDVSLRWPVADNWSVVGRWIYGLNENKSLDIFGGIEYDSCCWDLRVVGRRFVSNVQGDVQTGIFLQFELKGLANYGQKTVDFLYQNIPGYTNEF